LVSEAQLVTNGSITGAPCANSGINGGNAAGWSGCGFSPDLCCLTMPSYVASSSVTPVVSPDGGTWLGLAALGECAQTTITGLTISNTYTLYFCGACFGTGTSIYNQGPSLPKITVGASAVTFNIPMTASTWYRYSMTFVATAATMTLRCEHVTGSVSYASLDGFSLNPASPCGPIALPIELVSFGATYNKGNKHTEIKWVTSMEENVDYFEIQKSKNAIEFKTVYITNPKEGLAGQLKEYFASDDNTADDGVVYYRLMTVDKDGSKSYSPLADVKISGAQGKFEIFPNPASRTVNLRFESESDEDWTLKMISREGSLIQSYPLKADVSGTNNKIIELDKTVQGMYILVLSNNKEIYKTVLIVE
jgi:hypothetical protein